MTGPKRFPPPGSAVADSLSAQGAVLQPVLRVLRTREINSIDKKQKTVENNRKRLTFANPHSLHFFPMPKQSEPVPRTCFDCTACQEKGEGASLPL